MMPLFEVRFSATGEATFTVEAENEDAAVIVASGRAVGSIIDGGEASWELEGVWELESEPTTP